MNLKLKNQLSAVKNASYTLALLSHKKRNEILLKIAENLGKNIPLILKENKKDLDRMDKNNPKYDRLLLSDNRINGIINDIKNVVKLPDPLNKVLLARVLTSGIKLTKITVPFGVIGIIYEARPNVTIDVAALCLKSGNAAILRGGEEAELSNKFFVQLIKKSLRDCGVYDECVELMETSRKLVKDMLTANDYIDMIIPRGSQNLINFVRENATVPVIETGAGIVHIFVDETADLKTAPAIIFNAKTQRPSVCNAVDTVIIHKKIAGKVLLSIGNLLQSAGVIIYADKKSYQILKNIYPSNLLKSPPKYGTEFLSLKLSIKTVKNIDEALAHIRKYSSRHTEAILSKNKENIDRFKKEVDASAVFVNCSTRFTDGSEFGMGAEIGISTQKLHARGPMALAEIVSYKWIGEGNGQIRN